MFLRNFINFGVGVDFGVICVRTFGADFFFLVTAGDATTTGGATTGTTGGDGGGGGATAAATVAGCCGSCTFFSCNKYFLKAS